MGPYYFGIISLTASFATATIFCESTGLIWFILASYANKFRSVTGISTDWFSAFPYELETISFNTILPLHKAKNFASEADNINTLMKQLMVYKKPITSKKDFYANIGFTYCKKWDKMLGHPLLLKPTPIPNHLVVTRLIHELGAL